MYSKLSINNTTGEIKMLKLIIDGLDRTIDFCITGNILFVYSVTEQDAEQFNDDNPEGPCLSEIIVGSEEEYNYVFLTYWSDSDRG